MMTKACSYTEARDHLSDLIDETIFDRDFLDDLEFRVSTDRKTALKILKLVTEISKTPFEGLGKPEPLKYLDGSVLARRINQVDRLVYETRKDAIFFLQCRYHY